MLVSPPPSFLVYSLGTLATWSSLLLALFHRPPLKLTTILELPSPLKAMFDRGRLPVTRRTYHHAQPRLQHYQAVDGRRRCYCIFLLVLTNDIDRPTRPLNRHCMENTVQCWPGQCLGSIRYWSGKSYSYLYLTIPTTEPWGAPQSVADASSISGS